MADRSETINCTDAVALNAWYVLGAVNELPVGKLRHTRLLDTSLTLARTVDSDVAVRLGSSGTGQPLPSRQKFGYVWATLGNPPKEPFHIPEYAAPGRRNMNAASLGVHASAPRAVENFLDLAHFAFVHTGFLGVEPHTEIKPYVVEITDQGAEIWATGCRAYSPPAPYMGATGYEVEYTYRVPHPYCAVLYRSTGTADPAQRDVLALLLQPTSEEETIAHILLSMLDDGNSDVAHRSFAQFIFSQDKPILENQIPKRLPLSVRTEISTRADATSGMYRRWLHEHRVRYGTLPPEDPSPTANY